MSVAVSSRQLKFYLSFISSHLKLAYLSVERERVEEHRTDERDVSGLTEKERQFKVSAIMSGSIKF